MEVLLGILVIGIMGGVALATRFNWHASMGQNMGKKRMEEYGLEDEKKEYKE